MRHIAAAVLAAIVALAGCSVALAHQGNPNMESIVRAVQPSPKGVSIQVLNRDDRFQLINHSSQPIVIYGYNGDQYARLLPDGTVEQNTSSPAYYLNQDRYGDATIPKSASASAPPHWSVVDRNGRFEWHDHRMHWMGTGTPPSVKDTSKRQKVFDYTIPIRVGDQKGTIRGTLMWTPQKSGGPPIAAIVALVVLVLGGVGVILVVRRRRGGPGDGDAGTGSREPSDPRPVEAW